MHFVLHRSERSKQLAIRFDAYGGGWETEQEFACAVSAVFCESRNGDLKSQLVFHHFPNDFHLPSPAVRNNQIGELAAFVFQALIATSDHFLHGGVVVASISRLNHVFPIFFL